MKLAAFILAGTLISGCGPGAPRVTAQHAQWAQAKWPTVTMAELERGRTLFLDKCSACHLPPAPRNHSPAEWPEKVAEMTERAHLVPDEVTLIERYVVTLATAP